MCHMTWSILALAFLLLCKILFNFTTEFAPIYAIFFQNKISSVGIKSTVPDFGHFQCLYAYKEICTKTFLQPVCGVGRRKLRRYSALVWPRVQDRMLPRCESGCGGRGQQPSSPHISPTGCRSKVGSMPPVGADWMWRNAPRKA